MAVGFGIIIGAQGTQTYSLSQLYWNVDNLAWDEDFFGFDRVTAYDPFFEGSRSAGDVVQFTYQESMDGQTHPIITDGLGLPPLPTGEGYYYLDVRITAEGLQVFDYGVLEGGTVPSAVIPDSGKGWIYRYGGRDSPEIAHADPRNETVYYEDTTDLESETCFTKYAFDARGHVIGWWYFDGSVWYSPWGFADPSV